MPVAVNRKRFPISTTMSLNFKKISAQSAACIYCTPDRSVAFRHLVSPGELERLLASDVAVAELCAGMRELMASSPAHKDRAQWRSCAALLSKHGAKQEGAT